jgi:integrase/recombinase XerD
MSKSNRSGKSKCLNKEQLEAFISNLPQKYGLLAETMYFLAARVGEATSIRVRNINSNYQVVTLEKMTTKCKETREIPIGSKLLSDLQGWISDNDLKDDDYIFFSSSRNIKHVPGSKKLSNQSVDEYFSKTFDWIGIQGASTHSFRRSRLTHLMEKNWNVREIMDISGHKNLLSLQQYLDSDKNLTHKKYRQLIEEEVI